MSDAINCTFNAINGDIAGPGVRGSFYVQNIILVLLIKRSREDTENALWTFIATSFGLIIAALVQVTSNPRQLSFLEGILVSQLVWFANLGTFLALASYSRSRGRDKIVKVAAILQGYLAMILTIVMWSLSDESNVFASSTCLPTGPPAPPPVYFVVMFGASIRALPEGRIVALVFASLATAAFTALTFTEVRAWMKHGRSHIRRHEEAGGSGSDVEGHKDLGRVEMGRVRSGGGRRQARRHHRHESWNEGHMSRGRGDNFRQRWLPAEVGPVFFGIILTQLVIFIYFVSTTELIIQKSKGHIADSTVWGFGQILAMTVVIPQVIALWRAVQANLRPEDPVDNAPRLRTADQNVLLPPSPSRPRGSSVSSGSETHR